MHQRQVLAVQICTVCLYTLSFCDCLPLCWGAGLIAANADVIWEGMHDVGNRQQAASRSDRLWPACYNKLDTDFLKGEDAAWKAHQIKSRWLEMQVSRQRAGSDDHNKQKTRPWKKINQRNDEKASTTLDKLVMPLLFLLRSHRQKAGIAHQQSGVVAVS